MTIDNNLSWSHHIEQLSKQVSKKVYLLSRIKHFLNLEARKLFFNAHIQSVIDYASTLWDSASENSFKPLIRLHKRALKVVLLKKTTLSELDYMNLGILPLKARLSYNKGTLMHKIIHGCVPQTIFSKFTLKTSRQLMRLNMPLPRIDLFKSSLVYSGSSLWNTLPTILRQTSSTNVFKTRYIRLIS